MLKLCGSAPAMRKIRLRHNVASLRVRSQNTSRIRRWIPVLGKNARVRISRRKLLEMRNFYEYMLKMSVAQKCFSNLS